MHYQQTIDGCLGDHGVSRAELDQLVKALAPACQALAAGSNKAAAPLLALPGRSDDLPVLESLAKDIRKRFTTIVVAGTGGSGLSGRTLVELTASAPRFHFLENIDPEQMEGVLASIDLANTAFLIISKSGSTVETLSQFYVLLDYVGVQRARDCFFVITVPGDNPMRQSASEHGIRVLDHDPAIGGRFSILSNVGLLPAAISGLDIKALRRGAQAAVKDLDKAPALGAALQVAFMQKKFPMSVMLSYSERLSGFCDWYRQCWSESLGKAGKGSTPIRALGTTDQHSQLQLYLDGPKDKLFHMVTLKRAGTGRRIPVPSRPDLTYLQGKTMGDVMAAEQKATYETLLANHCPVRLFSLETLTEESMGALLMHFMLEIILTAHLLNVNPFDQPAVEQGKVLARDYLLSGKL